MTNEFKMRLTTATVLTMLLIGCDTSTQPATAPTLPTVQMRLGNKRFTLEVANTDATREHGLMQRETMGDDHGMIFVFGQEKPLQFWMKNTSIPLDIVFVNAAGRVVSIHQMTPFDLNTTPSGAPAKYAIELNQGAAAEAGVKVEDQLSIPPAATQPSEP